MQQAAEVATALQLSTKALQFYAAEHPRVVEAVDVLEKNCAALLAQHPRVTLTAAKGTLLVDGDPFVNPPAGVRVLAGEMEKRQLGGLVLMSGVTRRELIELVRLMALRAEQIKAAGGADAILRGAGVDHIRISHVRYEAITEQEEVVWSKSLHRGEGGENLQDLPGLLQKFLLSNLKKSGDAADAPDDAVALALEETQDPNRAREILVAAMAGMDPVAQLALLVSVDRLPPGPTRDAFHEAAGGLIAGLKTGGGGRGLEPDPTRALLDAIANNSEQLSLLRQRLSDMGVSREQLDELLDVLTWDRLSVDERIAKMLEADRMLDFPPDKFQHFIRELIESDRAADAHRLLERYVTGLQQDAVVIRRNVADGLGQIITFALPRESEQVVGAAILNQFVRETDAHVKNVINQAAANLMTRLIATGRCEPALRVFERLDASAAVDTPTLIRALGEQQRAAALLDQIGNADPDTTAKFVMPLVTRLGAVIAPHVIEALGNEEDRNRRGRLVKALKAIGEPAYPHLVDALRSQVWFVVRNALNVLGDIGTPAQIEAIGRKLDHGDPRVRRAAARALGKIGGTEAEALLVGALNDRDAETQAEVFLCLGSMKAQSAIPGLAELARAKLLGTDEKVRELALTTLGQIGSDAAVPVLGEILRAKSFLTRDSPAIRIAAGKALAAIKTPAARDLLRSAVTAETDRATKAALQKLV
jgi:HEAT repeat protein